MQAQFTWDQSICLFVCFATGAPFKTKQILPPEGGGGGGRAVLQRWDTLSAPPHHYEKVWPFKSFWSLLIPPYKIALFKKRKKSYNKKIIIKNFKSPQVPFGPNIHTDAQPPNKIKIQQWSSERAFTKYTTVIKWKDFHRHEAAITTA